MFLPARLEHPLKRCRGSAQAVRSSRFRLNRKLSRRLSLLIRQIQLQHLLSDTAITRAKRRVLLVGQKKALFMAIHKASKGKRNTLLGERMQLYYKLHFISI